MQLLLFQTKMPKQNQIYIAYQTDEIIVINKPCGMSTQGGAGAGIPLEEVLEKQLGQKVYLIHRLDRATSGLMIAAKSSIAAAKWANIIKSRQIKKEYMAISIGVPKRAQGTIKTPIALMNAETKYETVSTGSVAINNGNGKMMLSLIRAWLVTGRTHQIRIHLASIGCPIAGDDKHGNFAFNRALKKSCGVKSLCLSSVKLTLPDGTALTAPLPPHISQLITKANMDILSIWKT